MTTTDSSLSDLKFEDQFEEAISKVVQAKYLAVDTETTGLRVKDGSSFCIGISVAGRIPDTGEMFSYYFPVRHSYNNIREEQQKIFFEHLLSRTWDNPLIWFNAKFDLFSFNTLGIDLDDVPFYDAMIMTRMVNENYPSYRLDWLSKNVLRRPGKRKSEAFNAFMTMFGWSTLFPATVMAEYATGDTEETLYLFERVFPEFQKQGFDG